VLARYPPRVTASIILALLAPGPLAIGVVVLALVAVLVAWALRHRARADAMDAPLPKSAKKTLEQKVGYYRRLPPEEKVRFEREVKRFLFDQQISAPRGRAVPEDLKVLVAASAVMLVFGRKGYVYERTRDIVVYDEHFDTDYEQGASKNIAGMVHGSGPILFSARALRDGFANALDGHHVGLHEFAHVLDFHAGDADGVPSLMPWTSVSKWVEMIDVETDKIEARKSVLRDYGATNDAELFAVATEAFFEKPKQLAQKHPKLYAMLVETYGQDPANHA
jgi:Mlc titration factor MtfA (ptsG expression regulator)